LANAREGDLEHDISLERAEAAGLHTALVNVLRERMFHLMTSALEETLRAHPAPVLLHAIGDAFSLPPDSNAGDSSQFSSDRLLFQPFRITGEVIRMYDNGNGQSTYLVRRAERPANALFLLAPLIAGLIACLLLLVSIPGLYSTLRRRKSRLAALNRQVREKLAY